MGCALDNAGEDRAEAEEVVNGNTELGGATVDELKSIGGAALEDVDGAPNANPVVDGGGEVNVEPKTGDFLLCQMEPKAVDGAPDELEDADVLPPKLNIPLVPLLSELPVLIPDEAPPKLKVGGAGATVVDVEEEELRPKLNMPGEALVVKLAADDGPSEVLVPNFNELDMGPPTGANGLGPDEEAEELKPKVRLGEEPREVPEFTLNAGADVAENN